MKDEIVINCGISDDGKINGSICDILSRLIQECGRWTECYNSDILYDFESVKKLFDYSLWKDYKHHSVKENGDEVCLFKFGFRKMGVDHLDFIECRKHDEYRTMWVLEISKLKNPKYYCDNIQFKLWREF